MIQMKNLKLDKNLKSSLITYGMVIAFYLVMQTLVMTGNISSLMKGLLVPLCIYSIMAVSLNSPRNKNSRSALLREFFDIYSKF